MAPAQQVRKPLDMSRRFNGNSSSFLASGARAASNLTHGVSCANRDCNVFDPNVAKTNDGHWHCERHGGKDNTARAYAKDEKFANGIPGAERRARFARFRAKQKKETASSYTAHIPSFLDRTPVERRKVAIAPVATKKSQRAKALELLGLTEADIAAFKGA
jgi:hypothetical protein